MSKNIKRTDHDDHEANLTAKAAEVANLPKTEALQKAIFNSANFSSIATDEKGIIQIFNVGAERMLGYAAVEVLGRITPADISDPQEVVLRASTLSQELETKITPGFEALVFKASRGIEDIYELTYIRKDGSRFPAVVSVTALRDAQDGIIGYLLIGTDNTARKQAEEALLKAGALQKAIFNSANFSSIATDEKGVIQIFNVGAERMLGYAAVDVVGTITPADISDPQEVIVRANTLSQELQTKITPGFEALVFKASRGIEDIYELTYIRKDGSRFPAVVSVTALRDGQDGIIGYLLIGTDNTARKQAEEALVKAGALQKAIFNSANFSSIATDEKGVIQIFNVGAERMLGYTAGEVVGTVTPADISDPQEVIVRANTLSEELQTEITPGFEALVFKASRGMEDIYELTYIRKDGSRFPAVVSVTALRDAQYGIIGYLLIGTDNTARKQAEEALLKAGALQKAIFNSANFSSIATDEKGVIQIFNVGAERMLGYAAADVVGTITPADISDPQEVIVRANTLSQELQTKITPGFEALVFKASRGMEDIYELTYIRKDGSRFPAVVSVTALRDAQDGIIGYLLIGTDNTARKQVEAEQKLLDQRLRDQQFYTRSLIESNTDALMTTDAAGIITDINKQTEALTGRTRDELIGAPFKNYFTDPERAEAGIKRVLTERKLNDYELTARSWEGKETVVSCNATTLYNRDRKLLGVFAAARDITARKQSELYLVIERKKAKEELERLNKTLEERVTVRTTELVNANNELAAFGYSVAHELRAPIRHVDGFAIRLQQTYHEPLDDKGRQYVDKIATTSQRMGDMIDDLLTFTGLRNKEVAQERISLQELLLEARSSVEPENSENKVVWRVGELPDLYGDRSMLRQVFVNLLSNALKYSRKRAEAHVEIGCTENSAEKTVLFVRDNGVGFDLEYAAKLFKPFQRLHHESQFTGTGIGLAIVRRVIERHGGSVWAEGAVDKGATFYISLPMRGNNKS